MCRLVQTDKSAELRARLSAHSYWCRTTASVHTYFDICMPRQQAIEEPLAVAIIGRPNVGKSSLLNALAGAERSIVSPVAGTTRDAVDTEVLSHCLH